MGATGAIEPLMVIPTHAKGSGPEMIYRNHPAALSLEIKSDVDGFLSLQDDWGELVRRSSASVFQSFDWLFLWWKHFGEGPGRRPYILAFRYNGVLVGLSPFYIQLERWGNTILRRTLKTMGGGNRGGAGGYEHYAHYSPSDFMDIIAATDFESAVGNAVAEHISSSSYLFDSMDFANAPEDGILLTHVVPRVDPNMFRCTVERSDQCPRLTTPESLDNYLSSLRPSVRRRLHQAWTSFSGDSIATIDSIHSRDDLDCALQQLIAMHQKRWNALGYPGMFSDNRFSRFQQDLAHTFFEKGWLWCKRAHYAGAVIGCRMVYWFKGKVYDYLSGFDPGLPGAGRRPGLALLVSMVDDAVGEGMESIEFLRGDEQYKMELTSDAIHIWNITLESHNSEKSPGVRLAGGLRKWEMIRYRLHKEVFLARVQFHEHGPGVFVLSYVAFLAHRLRSKKPLLIQKVRGIFRGSNGTSPIKQNERP